MFTGRDDPTGRDEQYERLYLVLVDANPFKPSLRCFRVDQAGAETTLDEIMHDLVQLVLERNPDFFEPSTEGGIQRVGRRRKSAKGKKGTSGAKGETASAGEDDPRDDDIPEVGEHSDDEDDTDERETVDDLDDE